jgi:hypothetical protein
MFTRTSRYADVPRAVLVTPDGREIAHVRLRIITTPEAFRAHIVAREDRLDRIAFLYFRDPEQFWRLCDANASMRPDDLTAEPRRRLAVPQPR